MKAKFIFQLIFTVAFLSACFQEFDFTVVTLFLKDGDREKQRLEAAGRLYEHYQNSTKDRQTYEVVSKKKMEGLY